MARLVPRVEVNARVAAAEHEVGAARRHRQHAHAPHARRRHAQLRILVDENMLTLNMHYKYTNSLKRTDRIHRLRQSEKLDEAALQFRVNLKKHAKYKMAKMMTYLASSD